MVWFALALMAAAAVLCVSWPLARPRRAAAGATDVAFYREQLRELDADVDRGLLRPSEVEATRAELGRRLIQAADGGGPAPAGARRHRVAAVLAGALVVAGSAALYARVGRPGQPDAPLAARDTGRTDFAAVLAQMEAHLAANPDDGRGLELVAPVYMRLGRFDAAARAYRDLVRVLGPTPAREAALGQALVLGADGVVTAEARGAFDAALKQDPSLPLARLFLGLAALQDGDRAGARTLWAALIEQAPPDAPYTAILRQRIAELDGGAGGGARIAAAPRALPAGMPAGADAVAALPADQQRAAIHGMVDGLAARLAQDGRDPDGWLKLVRAYRVLGERDKAVQALAEARRSMTGDAPVLARLDQLARELGLGS